ncbi:hypothetical protein DM860_017117 [Cuscuta australis]|uniref:Peptidase A1 domain-containing protein n=1 Tax=Cuscuta australis TaxID=267555 RepID=A0A328DNM2_9ASTE|nr:hypothetical protein DM860_017117 [Cuscuta australis]
MLELKDSDVLTTHCHASFADAATISQLNIHIRHQPLEERHESDTGNASSTTRTEPGQKNRAVLSMTFYGSKYSQVFEPDASFAYRHASELNMSLHRIAYLHEKEIMLSNLSLSQVRENPAYREVFANYAFGLGLYLVEFYVGDEGLKQVLVLDTGSSIVWVHCQPCENPCGESYKITKPIYDPELSLGYQRVLCKDSYCRNPGTNSFVIWYQRKKLVENVYLYP